jgi:dihydropteroate synthase
MAIVNVTPDSFSDGGERLDPAQAIVDGLRFISRAPTSSMSAVNRPVRVRGPSGRGRTAPRPAGRRGLTRRGALVSIDTRRAPWREACLDAGARIVNDVSALRDDPRHAAPCRRARRVPVVLMHRRGRSEDGYAGPAYRDCGRGRPQFLIDRAEQCQAAGFRAGRSPSIPASASASAEETWP